jgi:dihydroorotate dehydrogenase
MRSAQRHASTYTSAPAGSSLLLGRLKVIIYSATLAASGAGLYLYATDTRASAHAWLVPPLLRLLYPDAEDAHHAGTKALQALYTLNLHPRERSGAPSSSSSASNSPLGITVFDTPLSNPIGISAGLDKNADIPDALFALGPVVVEVGGVTPRPQDGNPRPRVFRVPAVQALVNRYGLNSLGADAVAARLRDRLRRYARAAGVSEADLLDGLVVDKEGVRVMPGSLAPGKLLAVQIAKNKNTDEKDVEAVVADYVYCVQRLAKYADVLVVNVSSPNTPGLRDLQAVEPLSRLLGAVVEEARKTDRRAKPKVMVKVSPDEDDESQVEGVVRAVCLSGVDGVIVGNTTKRRAGLVPAGLKLTGREQRALLEDGGFSGPVTFDRTLELVGRYRKLLDSASGDQHKVIFASGGITTGQQALKVLNAGASLAMLYTGMVYGGSGTVTRIKGEMMKELRR